MARELATKSPSGRVKRTPLTVRNRLSLKEKDANYHYRIVNDIDGRIDQFLENGWEVVKDAKVGDKRVENTTGVGSVPTVSVGQGIKGVVLRIKKEWYEEDQASKMQEVDATEETMRQDARRAADYGSLKSKVSISEEM
jgi:hypothetical protein